MPRTAPARAVDVDHFYGVIDDNGGSRIDFLNSGIDADLCDGGAATCFEGVVDDAAERFAFGVFFVDSGLGRAEVVLEGGDLAGAVNVTECWDRQLSRTSYQVLAEGLMSQMMDEASCQGMALQSASQLGLPALSDMDPDLRRKIICAAESGHTGCLQP